MSQRSSLPVIGLSMVLAAVVTAGVMAAMRVQVPVRLPSLPAPTVVTRIERPTPDVLRAVQDLARLETVSFHMERVVDLREHQSRMWGLVEAEDAILLVAVGEVTAGVELGGLRAGDVVVDAARRKVTLTLPAATVFLSRLDSEHTYVHRRETDAFARRQEQLETQARQQAERSIRAGAIEAGVLPRAQRNAEQTLRSLVTGLGFAEVEIRWRE